MVAITIVSAILALTPATLASPVEKRDPGNFRLFEHHYYQQQCGPGACTGNEINSIGMYVHDDCNGGGCNSKPAPNLTPGESFCDLDFTVCGDRVLRLVNRGPDDCKALRDLSSDDNGGAYATLVEGDTDVGTCSVDFSRSKTCSVFAGGSNMDSQVYCAFF
ncbi:hypothetical protein G6011_04391 [Alternaria panax]|uniref:Uncharacterized protein n=1 Tax=Alternaria panax TaxID=48097 RepID=A0AAD4IH75_9PLEO|nr:hypothetical protein G6011_04391 [Alternaria panax]